MSAFRRTSRGIHATFDPVEVELFRHLINEVLDLLNASEQEVGSDDPLAHAVGISTSDRLPDDPALARLFPNAYENDEHAGEFRRYTEHGLRAGKVARLHHVASALEGGGSRNVLLSDEDAQIWAMALNDLRLTLGVRLHIDESAEERFTSRGDDDPEKGAYAVFAWLGWLQQTLIESLS
jgi:hypothetical protein